MAGRNRVIENEEVLVEASTEGGAQCFELHVSCTVYCTVAHKYKTQHTHTKHNTHIQNTTHTYKTQHTHIKHNTHIQNTTHTYKTQHTHTKHNTHEEQNTKKMLT